MSDVERIIKLSSQAFVKLVWPQLRGHVGGGKIIPVETVTDEIFTKELDTLAGIDAWHVFDNSMGIRGIASRVQPRYNGNKEARGFGKDGYRTFTVRAQTKCGRRTEEHKRIFALMADRDSVLFPWMTIQAYVERYDGPLLSLAAIGTRDLFTAYFPLKETFRMQPVEGGNTMRIIPWSWLRNNNASIWIWPDDTMPKTIPLFGGEDA